jgi:hypothetical protein
MTDSASHNDQLVTASEFFSRARERFTFDVPAGLADPHIIPGERTASFFTGDPNARPGGLTSAVQRHGDREALVHAGLMHLIER